EAFEARIGQAMPLSEYFIQQLSSQVDIRSIDGRARLGELARPLLERIPAGIFRELLADEVAKVVGLSRDRVSLVHGATPSETNQPAPAEQPRWNRPPANRVSAGRRNL